MRICLSFLETFGIWNNRIVVRCRDKERYPLDLVSKQPRLTTKDSVEVIKPGNALVMYPVHSRTELRVRLLPFRPRTQAGSHQPHIFSVFETILGVVTVVAAHRHHPGLLR